MQHYCCDQTTQVNIRLQLPRNMFLSLKEEDIFSSKVNTALFSVADKYSLGLKKHWQRVGWTTIRMAELGHNFKIQREKLFQELKAAFPSVPDPAVRQVMKQVEQVLIILKTVWVISIYQTQLQVNAYISERKVFVAKVIHNSMPWLSLLTVSSCESTQASWLVRRRIFNFLLPSKEKEKVY